MAIPLKVQEIHIDGRLLGFEGRHIEHSNGLRVVSFRVQTKPGQVCEFGACDRYIFLVGLGSPHMHQDLSCPSKLRPEGSQGHPDGGRRFWQKIGILTHY